MASLNSGLSRPLGGEQYVTTLSPSDVLFGRGSGPNDHEGNINFREVVLGRKTEYMATRHRQTKAKIAKEVVDSVFANNGRFLKKLEPSELLALGFDASMELYSVVDDDTIMEKAKQALRQNRDKESRRTSPKPAAKQQVPKKTAVESQVPDLPPSFVQGGNGQFHSPNSSHINGNANLNLNANTNGNGTGNLPSPTLVFSTGQSPNNLNVYQEQPSDYDTYITTLDDPEDTGLFGSRRLSTGSRRSSLLGGKRDGPRRQSMEMADVWKRDSMSQQAQSMQMSDLMESFKGMSTTGELNSSTDTIGTIEGEVLGKSAMSMSIASMASTNTALFKISNNNSDRQTSSSSSRDTFPGPDNLEWNKNLIHKVDMPPPGTLSNRSSWAKDSESISNLLQGSLLQESLGGSSALNFDFSGMSRPVDTLQTDSSGYAGSQGQPNNNANDNSESMQRQLQQQQQQLQQQLQALRQAGHLDPNRVLPP